VIGAISGDVIGSAYEASPIKQTDFPLFPPGARFTDDTVLTVATAEALLGAAAQAFYGSVPEPIAGEVRSRLPDGFLDVLDRFERRHELATNASCG